MALSSARVISSTSFLGSLSPLHTELKPGSALAAAAPVRGTCAYGLLDGKICTRKLIRKRDVRVGAKWLHGLKGESKTGGSGSSGSNLFERMGEVGSNDKQSTTATAVKDSGSQNGRAKLRVEDFDEDAYAEEEEEEDLEEEGFEALNVAERPTEPVTSRKKEGDVKKEQANPAPAQSDSESEPQLINKLRENLETVKLGMEEYFGSTHDVARLMTVENRKAFAKAIREERQAEVESMLRDDRENIVVGLSDEEKKHASKLLDEYADSIKASILKECKVLDEDESEYTVFNGRVVKQGPDVPVASEKDIADFVASAMEKAASKSVERFQELGPGPEGIPGVPKYPPTPEMYADARNEEELRERISQEKMAMYGEAAQMRQELREERESVLRERQAARAAGGGSQEQLNGRPSSWPEWKDGGDRFGADYDIEKDFQEAESVINRFEADVEREYGLLEEQLGLKPPTSAQNYVEIARTIEKLRADVEEELRDDETAGRQYLRKPISESDFAELEQMYREMVEDAEQVNKAGSELPPGALEALAAISGMLETLEDLIQNKRVEVVRDRDYLDALRAYMLAREGGSDSEEDFAPVGGDTLPSTPEEVLKEIEDNVQSLDYTLEVMNDSRRPLSASEIVEMQIMDEGLVRWRDEILELVSNQEQVSALAKLDSRIDAARPFYMVQQPKPLKPFTGFKDPNAAAVANAWADLIGEKKPVSPQEAVSSVWGGLFEAEEPPQNETEPARAAENGATPAKNEETTPSGGEDNVMTIGNGIQLDLSSVQADRLSTSRGAANAMASDPP